MTIFLSTQYLDEADRLADTIALLDRGVLVATGTAEELKSSVGAESTLDALSWWSGCPYWSASGPRLVRSSGWRWPASPF